MDKTGLDINQLIGQAQQGNSEAFGRLYDNFAQRIFKYIRLKIQDRQEAEDILQEVFIKAYRGLNALSLANLNFAAWLYKVASNTINDHLRKKYRTPKIVAMDEDFDPPDHASVEQELVRQSDWETAQKAFTHLPPIYKQVLELRFLQDLSLSEVSKILNKSNVAVRLIQHRAIKKVKLVLREKYDISGKKI